MRRTLKVSILAAAALATGCVTAPEPSSVVGDYLSGRLAAKLNAVDDAARSFEEAYHEAPHSNEILKDAFFFHLAAGDLPGSTYYAKQLVEREGSGGGDDGLARLILAAEAIKAQDYVRTRTLLRHDIESQYFRPIKTILDSWALSGIEGPDVALEHLVQIGGDEFKGFNPLHMALMAESAGRDDDARAAHQLSFMTLGGPVGREAYGAYLERAGDADTAREYYTLLSQEAGPSRRIAHAGLSRIEQGAPTNAFKHTTPSEGAAIALYSFGAALLEQTVNHNDAAERAGFVVRDNNYTLPLVLSQAALYLDPNLDVARRFVGSILNVYGDYEKAEAVLAGVGPASPYYEQAVIDRASSLVAQERETEAMALLRALIRQDAEASDAKWSLASLYGTSDQHGKAVETLTDLIDNLPSEPENGAWRYYVSRGEAYLRLDDWEKSEADLKRAVELAPEEPVALNYLGYMWAERGENLEEAFELIEKAVALQPDSGAIIDSLGWAHYQLGDYEEAVGHLEHAASLVPDDPTITDHLGDVYWRLGRKIEARYQWRRALELEPEEKLEKALNAKLKDGLGEVE